MVGMYIIKGGKRVLSKFEDDAAEKLLRSGKAKTPEKVMEDLDAAIQKLKKPGEKVIIKSGTRKASVLPTKEANALIKQGEAQAASTVLTQLKKAVKQTQTKKKGGGPLRGSKQIMNPRPIKKPKGVGAATRGYGKGYKK
jgi:phospholipase/lecithinase/hemolysin